MFASVAAATGDEVTVFLNGAPLFTADDSYLFDLPRREGLIGLDQATVYLPLRRGDNELVLYLVELGLRGWEIGLLLTLTLIGDTIGEHFDAVARREIPRIQADLDSYSYDRWYTMQAIRQSQRDGRWPRYTRSCLRPYKCPYFEACCAGIRVFAEPPSGFVRLTTPHPELEMVHDGSCNTSAAPAPDSSPEGASATRGGP